MSGSPAARPPAMTAGFPIGSAITRADLEGDPHPLLARLRRHEPVSWLPALGGWLVTRRDLALAVMRDAAAFTVDDPRFSTARVVGPSMLSLDGAEHSRHRAPFSPGFTRSAVGARLGDFAESQANALVDRLRPSGAADLRQALAGPLAVLVVASALGLDDAEPATVLSWYLGIVGAVSALTGQPGNGASPRNAAAAVAAGREAFAALSHRLQTVIREGHGSLLAEAATANAAGAASVITPGSGRLGSGRRAGDERAAPAEEGQASGGLTAGEVISNAAVLMFGGIETTEGMIANMLWHLLGHQDQLDLVRQDPSLLPNAVEESLRLEPAAAFVDRYATRDVSIGGADVRRGDLVSVSLAGAGRDPAAFADPDAFDVRRRNARMHLAFAHGPHFCLGAHLARLEAVAAVRAALSLPGLRLDPDAPAAPRGLVFRKPPTLRVRWSAA